MRERPSYKGKLVTEVLSFNGKRRVSAYVPAAPPSAIIFAADGQQTAFWGRLLEAVNAPPTMVVGVHSLTDETLRLHEYSPGFDPVRFEAHQAFFVENVRHWTRSQFAVSLPPERTAVFGYSAGGELALALGLRHPQIYGTIFCGSPGAGYKPPETMPVLLPRTYLVAGTGEPFFLENARRWARALRYAGADVVLFERDGVHGGSLWQKELPQMAAWAFTGVIGQVKN